MQKVCDALRGTILLSISWSEVQRLLKHTLELIDKKEVADYDD